MIIITSAVKCNYFVLPGDTFNLTVTDSSGEKELITEVVTEKTIIDYAVSFRFANEDGSLLGFHLCGFFGNKGNLPDEIKNAIHIDNLSKLQRNNLNRTLKTIKR